MTELQTEQGIVRVPTGTWAVDPIHSSVGFEVKHMMISTVRGHFKEYEGRLEAAEDYRDSRIRGSVRVDSIDTNNADRVGIAVRGTVDRTEFGLTWQQSLVGGGMLVGEQVALRIDISAVRA
jgi:polyisoprenoid-binding protein YceI